MIGAGIEMTDPTTTQSNSTLVDLMWALDGHLGTGNGDITGSCNKIAEALALDGNCLRDMLVLALRDASSMGRESDYGQQAEYTGVYHSYQHECDVAWWHNGGSTEWRDLNDCDDGEREYVGALEQGQ